MSNWEWTTPEEMFFTGVVCLEESPQALKHFYMGFPETACGVKVTRFLRSDDASVTCPKCRSHPGFFESRSEQESFQKLIDQDIPVA